MSKTLPISFKIARFAIWYWSSSQNSNFICGYCKFEKYLMYRLISTHVIVLDEFSFCMVLWDSTCSCIIYCAQATMFWIRVGHVSDSMALCYIHRKVKYVCNRAPAQIIAVQFSHLFSNPYDMLASLFCIGLWSLLNNTNDSLLRIVSAGTSICEIWVVYWNAAME